MAECTHPVDDFMPCTICERGANVMTPGEVADIFGVNAKTVTRWARTGRLPYFTTLGGHRRFHRDDIDQLLNEHGVGEIHDR